ncbi:hypothetical protein OS493_022827 [Desmophyllum pertusum]|uniref:Uncharacterized protein n=1 Tax=Desmophyllum pertusum TaxID=174260 RepID=A0A9X0A346_9CNID|nr:hypothetical protein OS493_022827 [Desmophyllum pertusum]
MELSLALLPVKLLKLLTEKIHPFSSTVKTLEGDTIQPSPGYTVHDQCLPEISNLESLPPLSDDELLFNLNWMHNQANEVPSSPSKYGWSFPKATNSNKTLGKGRNGDLQYPWQ